MQIPFRQGIVRYPKNSTMSQAFLVKDAGYITQQISTVPVEITFAYKDTNYYWTEQQTVNHAWGPFVTGTTYWLYWDIDTRSGQRTFGATIVPPTYSSQAPSSPITDQHWFDTENNVMKVWVGTGWANKNRVFAAIYNGVDILPPVGIDPAHFEGSQPSLPTEPGMVAGRIVFDSSGSPIIKNNGTFFTTEDQVFVEGSRVDTVRLESSVVLAKAVENIPMFHVVKFTAGGVVVASYEDAHEQAIGLATVDMPSGAVSNIVLQGIVTNPNWNWTEIGAKLWIAPSGLQKGQLVLTDFADISPGVYRTVPVARVLSSNTVIFDQGLGGRGDQGPPGTIINLPKASNVNDIEPVLGAVYLTTTPSNPDFPIAVGEGDPRLTDARTPSPHTHAAMNISFTPYQTILNTNVQSAIQFLYDTTLSSTDGGTITGLTLFTGGLQTTKIPIEDTDVVTKLYVDTLLDGLRWVNPVCFPNLISDILSAPPPSGVPGDTYIVQGPTSGAWTLFEQDDVVQLTITGSWEKLGTKFTLASCRYGVAHTSTTVPTGTFTAKTHQIAQYNTTTGLWTFTPAHNKDAYYVNNADDEFAYNQYVYNGLQWSLFGGRPQNYSIGAGLQLHANTISVVQYNDYLANPTYIGVDATFLRGLQPSDFAASGHTHPEITTENLPATPFTKTYLDIPVQSTETAQQLPAISSTVAQDMLEEIYIKSMLVPQYTNQTVFPPSSSVPGYLARSQADNKAFISDGTQYKAIATEDWAADKNHTHNFPYDMAFYLAGVYVSDAVLGAFAITRNVHVPIGCPGSVATVEFPAVGNVTYELRVVQGGVSTLVGTIDFQAGAFLGSFITTSALNLVPGDTLVVKSPVGIADIGIRNVAITIVGCTVATNCSMV